MICALVLAAGRSQRMGESKLLLPYAGKTIISHIIDQLSGSIVDAIFVVVGYGGEQVAQELSTRPAEIVINPHPRKGMLSSVRCGLEAIPSECEAIMVVLGDQPSLTSELIDQLAAAFSTTDKNILVPVYEGRRGHPLVFSGKYRSEIQADFDEVGLRGLLLVHPGEVFELPVSDSGVVSDMDSPEDYQRELERDSNNKLPYQHD